MAKLSLIVLALSLNACGYYAGISVAPNGVVWVAKNANNGLGGPSTAGIFACVPQGRELQCARMPTRGMD